MKTGLTIGELAKEVNINPKTIRYYEEMGLLPKPRRSESGYRLYSNYETERLRLVTRAKILGLSLSEIKELVDFAVTGRCNALERRLLDLVESKLGEIDRRVQDLNALRKDLQKYRLDLTKRLVSKAECEDKPGASASCQCLNQSDRV